ncbi:hypothetical protein V1478_003547 [Vespula squamosa]|uniref:Uncharacterized protein n=1 Tax=Vespula squamosa TaxID=30214 RepID=A0ABD2BM44_VESSQ
MYYEIKIGYVLKSKELLNNQFRIRSKIREEKIATRNTKDVRVWWGETSEQETRIESYGPGIRYRSGRRKATVRLAAVAPCQSRYYKQYYYDSLVSTNILGFYFCHRRGSLSKKKVIQGIVSEDYYAVDPIVAQISDSRKRGKLST